MQDSTIVPGATVRRTRGQFTGRTGTVVARSAEYTFAWHVEFPIDPRRPGGLTVARLLHTDELEVVAR